MFPEVFLNFSVIFRKILENFQNFNQKEVFLEIFPYICIGSEIIRVFLRLLMMSVELIKIKRFKKLEIQIPNFQN